MRPALEALAAQQKVIDAQQARLNEQDRKMAILIQAARKQEIATQQFARGLNALAALTGTDSQVRTAIFKRADEQNPAQPIPEPRPEPPVATTAETETPEAYADVRAPGMVPGTNQDTAADAVSTTYTPGADLPDTGLHQLIDVTRPVDGTQGPRPLSETKTLTDVRVGNPMNAQVAFPVNGPFAQSQRTSSVDGSARAAAAMKLANLRVQGSMSESGDPMVEFDSIVRDASLSDEAIQQELSFFEKQTKAAARVEPPRNLVPRAASVRTTPSLTSQSSRTNDDDDDVSVLLGEI